MLHYNLKKSSVILPYSKFINHILTKKFQYINSDELTDLFLWFFSLLLYGTHFVLLTEHSLSELKVFCFFFKLKTIPNMLSLFCKWFLNTMYIQTIKDIKDFISIVQQIMIETFCIYLLQVSCIYCGLKSMCFNINFNKLSLKFFQKLKINWQQNLLNFKKYF